MSVIYWRKNKLSLHQYSKLIKKKRDSLKGILLFQALLIFFLLIISQRSAISQTSAINWNRVAQIKPDLKVLVLVKGDWPISLDDLAWLADFGMVPADRDFGSILGLQQAFFSVRLKNWIGQTMPVHIHAKLLDRFIINGIYRVGFRVEEEGYEGPLSLEITGPRDGFGKQLIHSEILVRPHTPIRLYIDHTGNRWFGVNYASIHYREVIRFYFAFKYLVDMATLLDHDLMLLDRFENGPIPEDVHPFLKPGYKIDPNLPQAIEWAKSGVSGPPVNIRLEYSRLTKFVKDTVAYDQQKRDQYFGGKAIFSNLDDMYQEVTVTLSRGLGACPDTSLLECAFLRARGIPCRIAGRFGHFFTHVYVPNKGWMSTSVNPTGIPLIVAPGPDHIPYQKWWPNIRLKTIFPGTNIRIETMED
jgi:hypothetical protein